MKLREQLSKVYEDTDKRSVCPLGRVDEASLSEHLIDGAVTLLRCKARPPLVTVDAQYPHSFTCTCSVPSVQQRRTFTETRFTASVPGGSILLLPVFLKHSRLKPTRAQLIKDILEHCHPWMGCFRLGASVMKSCSAVEQIKDRPHAWESNLNFKTQQWV